MKLNYATISAFIGVLVGIIGIINQLHNLRKEQVDNVRAQAVRDKDVDDRLKQIENKLDEHNSYAEKFATLTTTMVEMQTDLRWIRESIGK